MTLTAAPAAGSSFSGWGGACSGTGPTCTVSMSQARSVTGGFALVPPETTITKKPKKQSTKRKVKFKFSSDQQGSTFECAVDGGSFEPCTSPAKLKLKPGWHTFRVRAIARTRAADPTPAKAKFRIKRKKR